MQRQALAQCDEQYVAEVILPLALDHAYSYAVPAGLMLSCGDCVRVPLGSREAYGIVFAMNKAGGEGLKLVLSREDMPALPEKLRIFLTRVAAYTLAPLGMVVKMAMGDPDGEAHEAPKFGLRLTGQPPERLTPTRQRVLAAAAMAGEGADERAGAGGGHHFS